MDDCMPLSLLTSGQSGRVSQLVGRADHVHRLREMGLRDGVLVEMLQAGRPCIIRLDGQRLCVRDDELLSVLVRPLMRLAATAHTTSRAVDNLGAGNLAGEPAS
jgi:Fe2+ transport system protein FeoA